MMSPLSIAQFLDPRTVWFDVIIFDEASQVRPQDALGALLRGNQVIVMGDTRQLPPTSFFDRIVEDEEYEEDPGGVYQYFGKHGEDGAMDRRGGSDHRTSGGSEEDYRDERRERAGRI
jgi:superfamily I DNA and/or RNA helicase